MYQSVKGLLNKCISSRAWIKVGGPTVGLRLLILSMMPSPLWLTTCLFISYGLAWSIMIGLWFSMEYHERVSINAPPPI